MEGSGGERGRVMGNERDGGKRDLVKMRGRKKCRMERKNTKKWDD